MKISSVILLCAAAVVVSATQESKPEDQHRQLYGRSRFADHQELAKRSPLDISKLLGGNGRKIPLLGSLLDKIPGIAGLLGKSGQKGGN